MTKRNNIMAKGVRAKGGNYLEINHITEFLTLVELGSFSRAAVELNMTQPTLTKHMQALERETGGKLLKRGTRGLVLSDLGEVFMPYAERIAKEFGKMESALDAYRRDRAASFSIGIVRNLQFYDVAGLLSAFGKSFPDGVINVVEDDDYRLKKLFAEGKLDLVTAAFPDGFGSVPGGKSEFLETGRGCIVAVLPESFGEVPKKLTLEKVCEYPLVIPERRSVFGKYICNSINAAGLNANIIFEGSSAGCLDFTKAGLGIALQTGEVAKGFEYPGMRVAPIEPKLSYSFGLLYRGEDNLTEWEKRFLGFIRNYASGRQHGPTGE